MVSLCSHSSRHETNVQDHSSAYSSPVDSIFTCARFSCVCRLTKEEKKQQKEEEKKERERKKLEKEKEKERKKREEARMKNRLKGLKAFKVCTHT